MRGGDGRGERMGGDGGRKGRRQGGETEVCECEEVRRERGRDEGYEGGKEGG